MPIRSSGRRRRYPFRRTEDEDRPAGQRLHTMLQRILKVSYSFPASRPLSEPCKDLITRMLVSGALRPLLSS